MPTKTPAPWEIAKPILEQMHKDGDDGNDDGDKKLPAKRVRPDENKSA